jgi:tetratricopeptide (TPR) repeat protein
VAVPALVLPLAVLAAMAPLMLAAFRQFDPVHVAAAGTPGGIVAAVFAPQHLLDLANLVLQLSPLAIAAPVLLVLDRSWRRREGLFLLALLAPYVAAMLIVHPYQGVFRDVDDFAAAGMALSLLTAWLTARALAAAPARAWLSAAIVLGVAAPAVQWMLLSADLERGLARVHAFATEAPRRSDLVIGQTWDFLGMRYIKLQRWSDGAGALEQAARYAPSSRILTQWAICEMRRGNTAAAHSLFERVLEKKPDDYFAWHELAATSLALGRLDRARHAASELLRLDPSDPTAPVVLQEIARREQSTGAPGR